MQKRSGTKITISCSKCAIKCQPRDGDWHTGSENQVFLCHKCKPNGLRQRPSFQTYSTNNNAGSLAQ